MQKKICAPRKDPSNRQKIIVETVDDNLCKQWDIQWKAFLPKREREYWVLSVKMCMAQEAQARVLFNRGERNLARKLRAKISRRYRTMLGGLSQKFREQHQVQVFRDPKQKKMLQEKFLKKSGFARGARPRAVSTKTNGGNRATKGFSYRKMTTV